MEFWSLIFKVTLIIIFQTMFQTLRGSYSMSLWGMTWSYIKIWLFRIFGIYLFSSWNNVAFIVFLGAIQKPRGQFFGYFDPLPFVVTFTK